MFTALVAGILLFAIMAILITLSMVYCIIRMVITVMNMSLLLMRSIQMNVMQNIYVESMFMVLTVVMKPSNMVIISIILLMVDCIINMVITVMTMDLLKSLRVNQIKPLWGFFCLDGWGTWQNKPITSM
ncbi:hypothetical protein ABT56_17440 [Photobacterium aquae]|uniref:Uncharacterized protein n=1 Tax=Photobacterium aquae TaxID=1195763 RepID=A0A0J1GVW1_9GAMM|nr:hypothetical protein ABT56_17440 [Photobacterium aquae]